MMQQDEAAHLLTGAVEPGETGTQLQSPAAMPHEWLDAPFCRSATPAEPASFVIPEVPAIAIGEAGARA